MKLRLPSLRRKRFRFVEPGLLRDDRLELVEPSARWIDSVLRTLEHPQTLCDVVIPPTRRELIEFINRYPRGREFEDRRRNRIPMYTFWMKLLPQLDPPVEMAGSISLRIGNTQDLRTYMGHIGYGVWPPARGRRLAERACRLLLPLARACGLNELWITANPDNHASRRTCERLGARLVDVVDLPVGHPLYERGDRQKCRYHLQL